VAKPTIAIIGYGNFSKLIIKHLSPYFEIMVASHQGSVKKAGLKFRQVDLKTALAQSIIIPSIPAQALEDFFVTNRQLVNPGALVIDVCSVKVKPVEILQRVLPQTVQILATHPMFGPTSAAGGLKGQPMMIYAVRLSAKKYQTIKRFLANDLKLHIIEATPKAHDQAMAYAQGLSHYIGRLLQAMSIPESELTTAAYDDLLDMKRVQGGDSWELFCSIMLENPYAAAVNRQFKQAIVDLDAKLGLD